MLIGFKYIGELIHKKEATDEVFVLGGEESYGLLKGDYARDKDGATGALPLAEYAAELKKQGKTLYDRLLELYSEHGLFAEHLANAYFEGAIGFAKMQSVMTDLRTNPPAEINGHAVTAILDYQTLERRDVATGEITSIDCAAGNVIALELGGDYRRRVTVRPSGTEPKLKFYIQWFENVEDSNAVSSQYDEVMAFLQATANALEDLVLQ
jgi:phosphoglucomutase